MGNERISAWLRTKHEQQTLRIGKTNKFCSN
jgi:hypothetical protein